MIRDLVIQNRSCRCFDESQPVGRENLLAWVENARLAASARNAQPLRYKIIDKKESIEKVLPLTKWAGALPDMHFPPENHHPTGLIIICHDTEIAENPESSRWDQGITASILTLSAAEAGFGACIIGSLQQDRLGEVLRISERYVPVLCIAFGVSAETVFLTEPGANGDVTYFRDSHNLHFVPKRKLEDIVLP